MVVAVCGVILRFLLQIVQVNTAAAATANSYPSSGSSSPGRRQTEKKQKEKVHERKSKKEPHLFGFDIIESTQAPIIIQGSQKNGDGDRTMTLMKSYVLENGAQYTVKLHKNSTNFEPGRYCTLTVVRWVPLF